MRHFQENGRTIVLRGVNLADGKFPRGCPTYRLDALDRDADCSYVDTPLALQDAPAHLERLRRLGFNVLRVPVVWEALEHGGPGVYDDDYIEYMGQLVELCVDRGFKVMINPHQDIWSRFVGGSGAPLWTLHACGLHPRHFGETHAAVRYSEWPLDSPDKDPRSIPLMMWTTNNNRLAASTLFTLFFAGRDFAPQCRIDGVNIQDYLQRHYLAAYARLARRLGGLVFGWDSMNEPESGFIGWKDLRVSEREDTPKIGTTPTPIQGMRLAAGLAQDVDDFRLGSTGPHRQGSVTVRPGRSCWLQEEDPRWRWRRDASWPLGRCVWALHGVWDDNDGGDGSLKDPAYFDRLPARSAEATPAENDAEGPLSFISSYWQEFRQQWERAVRAHCPRAFVFLQPSVFKPPPPRGEEPLTAYGPHYYDGLTIMHKHWHEHWNADVVGLIRGCYKTKALGLRVGRGNVRKVISDQLAHLAADIALPTLVGEIGIPFDLDAGRAYRDGDYSSHVKALDAMLTGCDDSLLSYALWAYSAINTHHWGDHWNGEDLSLSCAETGSFPGHPFLGGLRAPAAWCRPYVRSLTGTLRSMSFDLATSVFAADVATDEPGHAELYLPWLHYRRGDSAELAVDVTVSEGGYSIDHEAQTLTWKYERGGRLELKREGGVLGAEELGTIVKGR